ncbi:MAG: ATP-binding protein [Thermotaleaceae bacterium]
MLDKRIDISVLFEGMNIKANTNFHKNRQFLVKKIQQNVSDFLKAVDRDAVVSKDIRFIQDNNKLMKITVVLEGLHDIEVKNQAVKSLRELLISDFKYVLGDSFFPNECFKLVFNRNQNLNFQGKSETSKNSVHLENNNDDQARDSMGEQDFEKMAFVHVASEPLYTFDSLILPEQVKKDIENAVAVLKHEHKAFQEWGLNKIEPFARSALNFYGPSGTGKTMAAHAIASRMEKKILVRSYADIESKYHGEGPKNVEAIFLAAQRNDAVLFIDEADSLLSKRLTNVTQGSEQAINSMRSQLLICMEKFKGIVIFATNLVVNYDHAFETRLKSIYFTLPDLGCRKKIWEVHLLPTIPSNGDWNIDELAIKYDTFCGRDIKNAVIDACIAALEKKKTYLSQIDLIEQCDLIVDRKEKQNNAKDYTKSDVKPVIPDAIKEKLQETTREFVASQKYGEDECIGM